VSAETGWSLPNTRARRSYSGLGTTDVLEPDWASEAVRRLNRVSSVITVNESSEELGVVVSVTGNFSDLSDTSYGWVPSTGRLLKKSVAGFGTSDKPNDNAVILEHVAGRSRKVDIITSRGSAEINLTYNESRVTSETAVGIAALGGGYPELGSVVLPPNRTRVDGSTDTVSAPVPVPKSQNPGEYQTSVFFPVDLGSLRGPYYPNTSGFVGMTVSEARARKKFLDSR
jgi:hypothetical protein